jgi:hypothetical protein
MYACVISPLSDKIRLVVASGGGPMLKYIVTEDVSVSSLSVVSLKTILSYLITLLVNICHLCYIC